MFSKKCLFLILGLSLILIVFFLVKFQQGNLQTEKITIGIIMPMEHESLKEIVSGFKSAVSEQFPTVDVSVQNAQGDINLQRSIIQQFIRQKVNIIVPIGTGATQMALAMVKEQPILSLASSLLKDVQSKKLKNITGVIDEIGPQKMLHLLKVLYPNFKKITLVYSNHEKVFPEVEEAILYSDQIGIKIQKLMIHSLPELYNISRSIDSDSELIFILKDHMIVSGIQTLVKEAEKRRIPILSSDEGSVKEGAAFALGVKEARIGEQGGMMAAKLLNGFAMASVPVQVIEELSIFMNPKACEKQGVDQPKVKMVADNLHYELQIIGQP